MARRFKAAYNYSTTGAREYFRRAHTHSPTHV